MVALPLVRRMCLISLFIWGLAFSVHAQDLTKEQLEAQIGAATGAEKANLLLKLLDQSPANPEDIAAEVLSIGEAIGDSVIVGKALHRKALSHYFKGEYERSLAIYQRGFRAFEAVSNTDGQAMVLNDIGTLVKKQGDLDGALDYFNQALEISTSGGDSLQIASSLNNMGIVSDVKGDYDEAMRLFSKSASINTSLGNLNALTYNLDNMGMVSSRLEQWSEAESYFLRAADIRRERGDLRAYGIVINNIGEMHAVKGDPTTALPYFEEALDIARETHFADFEQYVLGQISSMHEQRGDYRTALSFFKTQTALSDSLFNETRSRQLVEMETKFDTERKEQTIALQEAKLERNYLLLGGVLVLLGLLIVSFFGYRSRMQLELIQAQTQAYLDSQEQERKRIALDLHDGLGQLISSTRLQVKSNAPSAVYEQQEAMFDEIHQEIRNIAFNLMPTTLLQQGAAAAIQELGRRISETTPVSIQVTALDLDSRLNESAEIAVFRIVQEWLNNVLKYGSPSEIVIQLIGHEDELVMMIEDDGKGFNTNMLSQSEGHGWKNIGTRSRQIGASVQVDSTAGMSGTTFLLKIPVSKVLGSSQISAA